MLWWVTFFFILIREIVPCLFYFSKIRLHAQMLQSCLTLCSTVDCSQPGSSVHGIVSARKLEWVVIPFCRVSLWPRDLTCVSCITGRFLITESPRKPKIRITVSNSTFIWWWHQFSSVQSLSCVWLFATPWTAACQASLSISNSQGLFKLMSIESVMLSNHLIFCHHLSPPTFNFSQHQGLFQWVSSLYQVAKVLKFQLHHLSFKWVFRTDFL